MSDISEQLKTAIKRRKKIEFNARGGDRIGYPHLLGYIDGRLTLEVFQTGGFTRHGKVDDWRVFRVKDVKSVKILDEEFSRRSDLDPGRRNWSRIAARA